MSKIIISIINIIIKTITDERDLRKEKRRHTF